MKQLSLLTLSGLLLSSSAMAWESQNGQHSTSAGVALSSDYVWRGYSQSDNKPALSGQFDYAHSSGFYVGSWASNVDFELGDDDAHLELDLYGGFNGEFGDTGIGFDVGVLRYVYPGTDGGNWNEVYGALSYAGWRLGVAHSGDVYGSSETGTYYNLGWDYGLPAGFNLSAAVGYYDYDQAVFGAGNPDSATDYRVGINKEFAGFGFDLSYTDTNNKAEKLYGSDVADGRFIFSISKSL